MAVLAMSIDFCFVFFFFSSRRRHTRSLRDWSSDVCSSDLGTAGPAAEMRPAVPRGIPAFAGVRIYDRRLTGGGAQFTNQRRDVGGQRAVDEIGRASCRERV